MSISIIYTVYTKVYTACFLYTEQVPTCTVHVLEDQTCQSVVGYPDYKLYNDNAKIQLCTSHDCDNDCVDIAEPSGCIVHGNIQFPYTFNTGSSLQLFGKTCVQTMPASFIPARNILGSQFTLSDGSFSNMTIAICGSFICFVFCIQFFKKYIV